ncbi:MAG: DUF1648 domain-containing protein [Terracidiphilus sp.]
MHLSGLSELNAQGLERWRWVASSVPLAATLYYVIRLVFSFRRLPAEVPVHFGFDGSPDSWMGRWAWLVVSPLILVFVLSMVFPAQMPRPGAWFSGTALLYWGVCGLVSGSFLEILRVAQANDNFRFSSLALWTVLIVGCECIAVLVFKQWWSV